MDVCVYDKIGLSFDRFLLPYNVYEFLKQFQTIYLPHTIETILQKPILLPLNIGDLNLYELFDELQTFPD